MGKSKQEFIRVQLSLEVMLAGNVESGLPSSTPHPRPPFGVMRKYLDAASVVREKILLRPPSLGGRLTDRKSEEQQADEVVSSTIDCQLTSEVHYTDRPEPLHDDLHFANVLITTYESLAGTNLSGPLPSRLALSCFCLYSAAPPGKTQS